MRKNNSIWLGFSALFAALALVACDDGGTGMTPQLDGGSQTGTVSCQICETVTAPNGATAERCRTVSCTGFTMADAGTSQPDSGASEDASVLPIDATTELDASVTDDASVDPADAGELVDGGDSMDGGASGPSCRVCRTYKFRDMEFQVCEDVECPAWVSEDGGEPPCEDRAFNGVSWDFYACDDVCYGYTSAQGWNSYLCTYLAVHGDAGQEAGVDAGADGGALCWGPGAPVWVPTGDGGGYFMPGPSVPVPCPADSGVPLFDAGGDAYVYPGMCITGYTPGPPITPIYGPCPPDSGTPGYDAGGPTYDGGVDAYVYPDFGAPPDFGLAPDFGAPPDFGLAPDFGMTPDSGGPDASSMCYRIYYPMTHGGGLYTSSCDDSGMTCYTTTMSFPAPITVDGGMITGEGYYYSVVPCA